MRNPNRLYTFYNEIMRIHMQQFPDWRYSQLMLNFFGWLQQRGVDPFYFEEDMTLELFKEFAGVDTENAREEG